MPGRPGIVVTGASGRMGRAVLGLLAADPRAHVAAALERPGHPWIGRDVGEAMGGAPLGITVTDDPIEAFARAQGVIDFTAPEASVGFADLAAQARAVHVIGTTGFGEAHLARIRAAARHAVIVRAGNMSLGVNLLVALAGRVAQALGEDWDVEIVEAHHRMKADAPSGTALMLGEAVARGRGQRLDEAAERGRDGMTGPRVQGRIGFAAIRGGDIVGEHDVIFCGEGERVVLRHVATDRAIFARGAIRAVLWGQDRSPGEYTMADVLGIG
ncbi:4-hydroxy-tetrahydrodipicolinate reductase [Rubellimicrobium sp. CFH 75288]|uniref:4-hydroxy-tetrahydrodipicolinate reductase n=1 Tax=Rubellimicrobium sp. CFH 75288 TaxID=2697034 RepID=UPI00141335E2|nr:4-hydroxy-tetrahydrodipicolinate reductase [Rubellimicrobium sp. CFH 75288]